MYRTETQKMLASMARARQSRTSTESPGENQPTADHAISCTRRPVNSVKRPVNLSLSQEVDSNVWWNPSPTRHRKCWYRIQSQNLHSVSSASPTTPHPGPQPQMVIDNPPHPMHRHPTLASAAALAALLCPPFLVSPITRQQVPPTSQSLSRHLSDYYFSSFALARGLIRHSPMRDHPHATSSIHLLDQVNRGHPFQKRSHRLVFVTGQSLPPS